MKIQREVLDQIIAHAKRETPIEACGYLSQKEGVVCTHFELTNVDHAEDHYTLDPKEQFDTIRAIRARNERVSAVYHSHPESPARMSEEDIRLAFDPSISYVIVSLLETEPVVKSFKVQKGVVTNEAIEIVD